MDSTDRSQMFVVRVWTEQIDETQTEYRGQVQHVLSGEIRHFRDWQTLNSFLANRMEEEQEGTK